MTRIELASKGIISEEIKECALSEGIVPEQLAADISEGLTVIPVNRIHDIKPMAIGKGLRIKVNANIGTSKDRVSLDDEIEKLDILVTYGADAIMDLSTGGPITDLRRLLLKFKIGVDDLGSQVGY